MKMPPVGPKHYNLIVIGGGSGGIAHARRAAEYGIKAAGIASVQRTNLVQKNPAFLKLA